MVSNETPVKDRSFIELDVISDLVEEYEEKNDPIEMPALAEIIKDEMEERGITQNSLLNYWV